MSAAQDFLKRRAVDIQAAGRYSLASRYDGHGKRRQFACRTTRISPFQMLVAAPVLGPIGERVISHFGELGHLEGFISDFMAGGFLVELKATKNQRRQLTNKLEWIEARAKDATIVDVRQQERIIPEDPHTTLLFGDGTALTCFVIDASPSGVAVSADIDVEIGTRLAVGRSVGHIVRQFDEGFAVKFDELVDPGHIEQAIKPTSALKLAAAAPPNYNAVCYLD